MRYGNTGRIRYEVQGNGGVREEGVPLHPTPERRLFIDARVQRNSAPVRTGMGGKGASGPSRAPVALLFENFLVDCGLETFNREATGGLVASSVDEHTRCSADACF